MSKMVKLLKKAQQMDQTVVVGINAEGADQPITLSAQETIESRHEIFSNSKANPVVMTVMGALCLVVLGIMVLSLQLFQMMRMDKNIINELVEANKSQTQRLAFLENSFSQLETSGLKEVMPLKDAYTTLNLSVKRSKEDVNQINIQANLMRIAIEDLKTTDRLLLDKTISLNSMIKEMQQKLLVSGKEI